MSKVIESLEREQLRKVPAFQAGDRVRVHFQVVEGSRRRTQVFEGVVIKRQGSGARETFTVRKQSFGVGVERTFPVHSPKIERIEVASHGDVRRAKLYYLRGRIGKAARVRERQYVAGAAAEAEAETGAFDDQGAQDEAAVLPPEEGAEVEAEAAEATEAGGPTQAEATQAEATEATEATEDGAGEQPDAENAPEPDVADEPQATPGDEPPAAEEPESADKG